MGLHLPRINPVVGRAGIFLPTAADVGTILDPRYIAGIGEGRKGIRPFLRIQADKGPLFHQLIAKVIVLFG